MRIKKYEVYTMKDAIDQIKQDFGSNAVILHSKTIKKGGLFGVMSKNMIEVVAGVDINIVESATKQPLKLASNSQVKPLIQKTTVSKPSPASKPHIVPPIVKPSVTIAKDPLPEVKPSNIEKILSNIEKKLFCLSQSSLLWEEIFTDLFPICEELKTRGFSEIVLKNLFKEMLINYSLKDLQQNQTLSQFLNDYLLKTLRANGMIRFNQEKEQQRLFIMGATGVGKTTTIAKLAAKFTLFEKKKVGLITIDTYRIAAIEQLKTFAEILHIDIDVVYTPEEFKLSLERAQSMEFDVVLIDTAGRSPHHKEQLQELKAYFDVTTMNMIGYLVLSLTSKIEDLLTAIRIFNMIPYENLILTKFDETQSYGAILDLMVSTTKSISYLSTGQVVPDDFEEFDPSKMIQYLIPAPRLTIQSKELYEEILEERSIKC